MGTVRCTVIDGEIVSENRTIADWHIAWLSEMANDNVIDAAIDCFVRAAMPNSVQNTAQVYPVESALC